MRKTATATNSRQFQKYYSQSIDPLLAQVKSIPAPTWGWDAVNQLADMPPDHAVQLDNFIPRPGYCEVRRGSSTWSGLLGSATTAVESLLVYNGATASSMFAAAGAVVYDVSTSGLNTSILTGKTSARWQQVNFTNSVGSHYMAAANGSDTPILYDGTTWSNMNVTCAGLTLSNVINLNSHHGRLWLIQKNSTKVFYLPVGFISGAALPFDLGDLMNKGGSVIAMGTWTVDTKTTVDDYAVFITSNGTEAQAIVYAGTDPASADTWQLNGIYNIGTPIGRRCLVKVAGDLGIICIDGIVPMSQILSTDRGATQKIAITANIQNEFLNSAQYFKNHFGWEMIIYPLGMLGILNVPVTENYVAMQYVINSLTGSWCRFTGLNANCFAVYNDNPYFGDNNGHVVRLDTGSDDQGLAITATMRTAYNYFGERGRRKRFTMLRPLMTTDGGPVTPGIGLNTDFNQDAPITTPIAVDF